MRLTPKVFWSYSLREWHYAIDGYIQSKGGNSGDEAFGRDGLGELMEKYPDVPGNPS